MITGDIKSNVEFGDDIMVTTTALEHEIVAQLIAPFVRDGQINLTRKTLFDSEVYYLQRNDVVYVEANKKRKRQAVDDPNLRQDILPYVR